MANDNGQLVCSICNLFLRRWHIPTFICSKNSFKFANSSDVVTKESFVNFCRPFGRKTGCGRAIVVTYEFERYASIRPWTWPWSVIRNVSPPPVAPQIRLLLLDFRVCPFFRQFFICKMIARNGRTDDERPREPKGYANNDDNARSCYVVENRGC